MSMTDLTICCPCLFGLESVLSGELKRMGARDISVMDGKVSFKGGLKDVIKANIYLRTAERVLIVVGSFKAVTFTELFDGTTELPFEDFIGLDDAFPVKGYSINSTLFSVSDCQSIIKKAVVRRLQSVHNTEWFSETGNLFQLQFSIYKDEVTIMLDTSGAGLHKRGYRQNSTLAPIKETLAAGIIDLAHVRRNNIVCDPFCGSGTFVIEGAMHAFNIAPGLKRRFAAEKWGNLFTEEDFLNERRAAMEAVRKDAGYRGYGYDIDGYAVDLSAENAHKAGVGGKTDFEFRGIEDFVLPSEEEVTVICNPPYGERLLDTKEARELYKIMGEKFSKNANANYYIITADEEFEQIFGRKADKRRKLYNGMIKCQLFMYYK